MRASYGRASHLFADAWQEVSRNAAPARFATGIRKLEFSELVGAVQNEDAGFVREFVRSFYSGEVYIFTNAFDPLDLVKLKTDAFNWGRKQESREPKILSRIPDYVSRRDWHAEEHGPGYSSTYNMMHFFRWNDDPVGAFRLFEPKYRILRTISGYGPDDIRDNGPDDGVIDRAEISHYPPGVGGIAFHSDPIEVTRFALTLNLNRYGIDYMKGGFAVGTGNGKVLAVDPLLEVGSLTGFLPSVCHGVEVIDPDVTSDPDEPRGRWYAAISMVTSHKVKGRAFTVPMDGYPTLREQIRNAKRTGEAS